MFVKIGGYLVNTGHVTVCGYGVDGHPGRFVAYLVGEDGPVVIQCDEGEAVAVMGRMSEEASGPTRRRPGPRPDRPARFKDTRR